MAMHTKFLHSAHCTQSGMWFTHCTLFAIQTGLYIIYNNIYNTYTAVHDQRIYWWFCNPNSNWSQRRTTMYFLLLELISDNTSLPELDYVVTAHHRTSLVLIVLSIHVSLIKSFIL